MLVRPPQTCRNLAPTNRTNSQWPWRRRPSLRRSQQRLQYGPLFDLCRRRLLRRHGNQHARNQTIPLLRRPRLLSIRRLLPQLQPHCQLRLYSLRRLLPRLLRRSPLERPRRNHDGLPARKLQRPLHRLVLDHLQPRRRHRLSRTSGPKHQHDLQLLRLRRHLRRLHNFDSTRRRPLLHPHRRQKRGPLRRQPRHRHEASELENRTPRRLANAFHRPLRRSSLPHVLLLKLVLHLPLQQRQPRLLQHAHARPQQRSLLVQSNARRHHRGVLTRHQERATKRAGSGFVGRALRFNFRRLGRRV